MAIGVTIPPTAGAVDVEDLLFGLRVVPLDGEKPPAFTLSSLAGPRVALSDLRGRAVLLYFWATW